MEVDLEMDSFGRILFPKALRDMFTSRKFIASVEKKNIVLRPVQTLREAVGSCPNIDMEKFLKERHEGWYD